MSFTEAFPQSDARAILQSLDAGFANVAVGDPLREALTLCPQVVWDESNPVEFHSYKGVKEALPCLAAYWQLRVDVFGADRAYAPLEFGTQHADSLLHGDFCRLPNDKDGNRVLVLDRSRLPKAGQQAAEDVAREAAFLLCMKVGFAPVVLLIRLTEESVLHPTFYRQLIDWLLHCFPVEFKNIYVAGVAPKGARRMYEVNMTDYCRRTLGEAMPLHFHIAKSKKDLAKRLLKIGLLHIPKRMGGAWQYSLFGEWLRTAISSCIAVDDDLATSKKKQPEEAALPETNDKDLKPQAKPSDDSPPEVPVVAPTPPVPAQAPATAPSVPAATDAAIPQAAARRLSVEPAQTQQLRTALPQGSLPAESGIGALLQDPQLLSFLQSQKHNVGSRSSVHETLGQDTSQDSLRQLVAQLIREAPSSVPAGEPDAKKMRLAADLRQAVNMTPDLASLQQFAALADLQQAWKPQVPLSQVNPSLQQAAASLLGGACAETPTGVNPLVGGLRNASSFATQPMVDTNQLLLQLALRQGSTLGVSGLQQQPDPRALLLQEHQRQQQIEALSQLSEQRMPSLPGFSATSSSVPSISPSIPSAGATSLAVMRKLVTFPDSMTVALNEAFQHAPQLVKSESNVDTFLRSCRYNVGLAAQKLAGYWTFRKQLFGAAFLRPLNLRSNGALSQEDCLMLQSGSIALIEGRDGSPDMLFFDRSRCLKGQSTSGTQSRLRCLFYFASVVADKEANLSNGVVIMKSLVTPHVWEMDYNFISLAFKLMADTLPLQIQSIHLTVSPPKTGKKKWTDSIVAKTLEICTRHFGSRSVFIHRSSDGCVLPSLMEHGFLAENLPSVVGGHWKYENFTQWLRHRNHSDLQSFDRRGDAADSARASRLTSSVATAAEGDGKERKRLLNVIHSRQKRERRRTELESLKRKHAAMTDDNARLKKENTKMTEALVKVKGLVTAIENGSSFQKEQ